MEILRGPSPGRTAMVLVLIALLLTVCVAVYLFLARALSPGTPGESVGDTALLMRGKLLVLLMVVLGAILLILVFVIGSYALMRVGRSVSRKRVGGKPTEYSDAWSEYRLSQEQIDAVTGEQPGEPDGTEPEDENEPP